MTHCNTMFGIITYIYTLKITINFIVSLFIRLNIKPLCRASFIFLFNSYKPRLPSEIGKLIISLFLKFVKLILYIHLYLNE